MSHSNIARLCAATLALACLAPAWAQTLHVDDAWARATVPGQKSGSAFMTLHADQDVVVTGVTTPAAEKAEIHTMEKDGDIMRMRALPDLPVPANTSVQLTPSGQHVMLMNLKQPLHEGDTLALELQIQAADGNTTTASVQIPVLGITAHGNGHDGAHMHMEGHHDE